MLNGGGEISAAPVASGCVDAFTLPADAVLDLRPGQFSPAAVLDACRAQLSRVEADGREFVACRAVEALYHPGRYLRIAYVLLADAEVSADRTWPEGQLVYFNIPIREPVSRRGRCVEIHGRAVEAYVFPNDRRLRGVRHFAGKESAAACWQSWLTRRGDDFAIAADSLQRLLVRYVPEQKWIIRLRAEGSGGGGTRRIAVRAAAAEDCARLFARHRKLALLARHSSAPFVVPDVVGIAETGELLAVEWIRGDSLLETLRAGDAGAVMSRVAEVLSAFHGFPCDELDRLTPADVAERVVGAARDLAAAAPQHAGDLSRLGRDLVRLIELASPDRVVCLHDDFHWNQFRIKPDRFTLLDFERIRAGDPLVDAANFAAQVRMLGARPEVGVSAAQADMWSRAFIDAWERITSEPVDTPRFRALAAASILNLARGNMRHLRPGWPALLERCIAEAGALVDTGGGA